MLELVLQGIDLLFKYLQGWSFHLSSHSPGGYSCVYRAVFPTGPREGFLQHKLPPPGFAGYLLYNHLLLHNLLHSTSSWHILPSAPLLQAGGSSSLSPDPPREQTHRAAGPGLNCDQVLPHKAGTDLRRGSMCHLVSVLTKSNSAQSFSASPSQMLLSASFPTHPPHTIQPGLNIDQPVPVWFVPSQSLPQPGCL